MKYSFALAALVAVVSMDSAAAINLSAEPVLKKEEPKKDEAAIQAKFDALKAKKEAADDKAKEREIADSKAAEEEVQRKKDAYRTAYWGHMKDQADETQRIKDLRVRPESSKPMEGHVEGGDTTKAEHWTINMPLHIQDNKVGPTAAWDSPKPPAPGGGADDAATDEEKADKKKKEEAAAIGAKVTAKAAADAAADKSPAPAQVVKEWFVRFWAQNSK